MANYEIGIVCAIDDEYEALTSRMTDTASTRLGDKHVSTGTYNGSRIVVIQSGVGNINAALTTAALIQTYNPSTMLFSGIAGALNPELKVGDVLIGNTVFLAEAAMTYAKMEELCTLPPVDFTADPELQAEAEALFPSCDYDIKTGTIVTSDHFPAPVGFEKLMEEKGAEAIDMETAAFYQTCHAFGKKCLGIRSFSNPVSSHEEEHIESEDMVASSSNAADFCFKLILALTLKKQAEAAQEGAGDLSVFANTEQDGSSAHAAGAAQKVL